MQIKKRPSYTTGQLVAITTLSQQTIHRAIDNGSLAGFHVPNSTHRRVAHDVLIKWMTDNGLPIPSELSSHCSMELKVELTPALRSVIEGIKEATSLNSDAEVFSCAFSLLRMHYESHRKGSTVFVRGVLLDEAVVPLPFSMNDEERESLTIQPRTMTAMDSDDMDDLHTLANER